jgi:pyridoxamine 5'-phosphate oxidase
VDGEAELRRADLDPEPLEQFRRWYREAVDAVETPNAMALATAASDGMPSVRMVLCKGFVPPGFVFFSHYTSRKGRELEANPQAALLFHWPPLGRQVRVEGTVKRISPDESDGYFRMRPRDAQLGALASRQSEGLESREKLEERLAEVEAEISGSAVPRPPTWGGYILAPEAWEFWQHRASRLHDRFRYELKPSGDWRVERLFP